MSQGQRMLLAVAISFGILFLFPKFFPQFFPEATTPIEATQETKSVEESSQSELTPSAMDEPVQDLVSKGETKAQAKEIVVENDVATLVLSTKGAQITSYELKTYKQTVKKDSPPKNLLTETEGSYAGFVGLKNYPAFNSQKVFELVSDTHNSEGVRTIKLRWANSQVEILKTFTFGTYETPYASTVDYQVKNLSSQPLAIQPYLQNQFGQKEEEKSSGVLGFLDRFKQQDLFGRVYYTTENEIEQVMDWNDLKSDTSENTITWAGLADRYFLLANVVLEGIENPLAEYKRSGNLLVERILPEKAITLNAGQSTTAQFQTYFGPKINQSLQAAGHNLSESVDYGWFSFMAMPILWLMTLLYELIGNWGLAIIALTFIVKLILHPVNKKAMTSMKGMQQLQPKLKELKEKYADDRDKLNQATMQLFKTHGVNPASGCLPMLLQMPIYIVLYKVLWNSIELYHAPFFWVYQDLSAPDPYFIAPVLMGIFMFLQQKLTPAASADQTQQKMMMILPLMFTVFMLFLPVGLVLYIFVNTVMSVIQQYLIKKDLRLRDVLRGRFSPQT